MSGWCHGGGGNMDPAFPFLAQTMINVAQNLLTSQHQDSNKYLGRRSDDPGPWSGGLPPPGARDILGSGQGDGGRGLLGSGPGCRGDMVSNQRMSQQMQQRHPQMSTGQKVWFPGNGNDLKFVDKSDNNSKNKKNYLPKIKEEGSKPHYYPKEYESVPGKFLQCHLCGKDPMWDGGSFVRHLLGNSHNHAMEKLIQSDVERVGKLRKAISEKIKKEMGFGKSKCGMCDVRVKDITQHRRDEAHGKLREFIHPHCEACDADFEDRSDWYYHKYSAHHLHCLQSTNKSLNYSPFSSRDIENIITKIEKQIHKKQTLLKKNTDPKPCTDDEIVIMEEKIKTVPSGPVNQEDLESMDFVGARFIKPVNGLFCKLCKKFFMSEYSEVKQHCSSLQHVESVQMIENQTGIKRKSAAESFDSSKKAK